MPQGSYVLTAVATDNQTATTTSAPVNVTVQAPVAQLYFVEVDHLNTPRLISDSTGTAVWRHDQAEPFGNSPPDENPSSLGAFEFPLRFPGQYADKETNLAYNVRRDYDALLGRYAQSDPIGLRGGLNTYAYVDGSPLSSVDPNGLLKCRWIGLVLVCNWGPPVPADPLDPLTPSPAPPAVQDPVAICVAFPALCASMMMIANICKDKGDDCGKMLAECNEAIARNGRNIPCFACFQQCQGQGKWPNSIPAWTTVPGNYQRSCAYW